MPTVQANGIDIYYEVQGEGEPMVLIPYLAADQACYAFQVAEYAEHFRCYTVDLRGAGLSGKPEGTYTTELLAEDIAAFMQAAGVDRAHIFGLSLGASVGMWLAAQHPDWRYLTGEPDDAGAADPSRWELGTTGQRAGYLAAFRRADPDAARELLAAGWAEETPEDRATLLAVLATGLSLADQELLEIALDDRRREVRGVALDLLGRLPGSAYQERMIARALRCLRRERGGVTVVPPTRCDREMRHDGISPRPPAGVGERAWWLEEILARTPLSVWGDDPARFLALRVADGWRGVVLRGLARATSVARDPAWAGALVDALIAAPGARERPDDMLLVESLYAALPPGDLVRRAVEALRRGGTRRNAPGVDHLLELCPRPWPPALYRGRRRSRDRGLVPRLGFFNRTSVLGGSRSSQRLRRWCSLRSAF